MPLPRHFDFAQWHESSQAEPWQLRLGAPSKVCATTGHCEVMHSATSVPNGELVFFMHAKRHASSPHAQPRAQVWACEQSASARHASTLLPHLSMLHVQTSLHAAAPQSTVGALAESMSLEHLLWTHSNRVVADGEKVFPTHFNAQLWSPHAHLNAQSCCLAHCSSPMQSSISALHSDREQVHVSEQVAAPQSMSKAWTAKSAVALNTINLDIMLRLWAQSKPMLPTN